MDPAKRWQDWMNLALGAWLFFSPWALGFFREIGPRTLDFAATGAAIAALAALALTRRTLWNEWITLVLGMWMAGSPWLLGFASSRTAMPDAAVVGAIAAALSIWVILRYTPDP